MIEPEAPVPGPSRRSQVWSGIGLGLLCWIAAGLILAASPRGVTVSILLIAYLGLLIAVARAPGRGALVASLLITTVAVPVLAILAVIGMCSQMHI